MRSKYEVRIHATRKMTDAQIVKKLQDWSISATRCPDDSVSALMYEAAYRIAMNREAK